MLQKLFDRDNGASSKQWSFFDGILRKYLSVTVTDTVTVVENAKAVIAKEGRSEDKWRERLAW